MDLIDRLTQLAAQIPKQRAHIATEEATKTALVMPFISALGYDVFDAGEVTPEFTADIGTKKGEKVDYAILRDGVPIFLIEVKCLGTDLSIVHASQLYRYFSVTAARFSILTDGATYRFYSDLDAPNKMDDKPFLVFDLLNFDANQVDELKRFSKSSFDIDNILSTASELKYTREIKALLAAEFTSPTEHFVRHFASQVYTRRFTQAAVAEFTELTRRAFRDFVNDRIEQRLRTALDKEALATQETPAVAEPGTDATADQVTTTPDEINGHLVIKAILCGVVDVKRIVLRDVRSYCGVLLDDNRLKPICRLYFNSTQKYIGLFDHGKQEEKIAIQGVEAIYQHAERLKATIALYEQKPSPAPE
jgi:hypothetical protein